MLIVSLIRNGSDPNVELVLLSWCPLRDPASSPTPLPPLLNQLPIRTDCQRSVSFHALDCVRHVLLSPMKLWTDDKASVMEAFISSPAAAPEHHPPHWPPCVNSAASSTATSLAVAHFSPANLQQRLHSLIEGARESWTYAIYWRSCPTGGAAALTWGDGYYRGCEEDKGKPLGGGASSLAEQEHRKHVLRELNALVSGGGGDDAADED
ncbi:unnamed protein product, partial [Musa hybrid cultivar]